MPELDISYILSLNFMRDPYRGVLSRAAEELGIKIWSVRKHLNAKPPVPRTVAVVARLVAERDEQVSREMEEARRELARLGDA